MLKRILSIFCTAAVAASVCFTAFADVISTNTETFYFDRTDARYVILTCFDEEGNLAGVRLCDLIEENGRSCATTSSLDGIAKVRVYIPGDDAAQTIKDTDSVQNPAVTPVPSTSPAPSVNPSAPSTPSAKPEKSFPAVYPHEVDAIRAPALIKEVSSAVSEKGENVIRLKLLYQGKDYELEVEQGFILNSIPDALSYFSAMAVDNLEPGDIIDMSFYLSGELKTMNLILRPAEENIITSGTDYGISFEKLFSSDGVVAGNSSYKLLKYGSGSSSAQYGYAFGVLTDKSSGDITLMNKEGMESKSLILDLDPETVVYVCDMSNRKEIYQGSVSALSKTNIPKSHMDEDGNVINWSDDQTYNYVFVRTVENTAADIVIYTNYNDR